MAVRSLTGRGLVEWCPFSSWKWWLFLISQQINNVDWGYSYHTGFGKHLEQGLRHPPKISQGRGVEGTAMARGSQGVHACLLACLRFLSPPGTWYLLPFKTSYMHAPRKQISLTQIKIHWCNLFYM